MFGLQSLIYIILVLVLAAAFIFIPKRGKTKIFGIIILSVALVFEVGIANMHAWRTQFDDTVKRTVNFKSKAVTVYSGTFTDDGSILIEDDKIVLFIYNINEELSTATVHCDLDTASTADLSLLAEDETYSQAFRVPSTEQQLINGDEDSETFVLDYSGKISAVKITIESDNPNIKLKSVSFNNDIPVTLSVVRLLTFVGIITLLYLLLTLPSLKKPYCENKPIFLRTVTIITIAFIVLGIIVSATHEYQFTGHFAENISQPEGNQISQELVDSFEAGRLSMLEEPSRELLDLENPYDYSQRQSLTTAAKWDHLLFNGKYYSYYGIAPVILVFMPYHLITGSYLSTSWAVSFFGSAGMIFLALMFAELTKRFFRKIPVGMLASSLIVLFSSCGVWYLFAYPKFYEIASSSAFMFTAAGFWLLIRSGIASDKRIKLPSLTLSGICLALGVLSRPTAAMYCICAVIFIGYGFVRIRKGFKNGENILAGKSSKIKTRGKASALYLFCGLVGFVVFGGIQMAYNYLRFGSPFDFGISYSLTINDFTRSEFYFDFLVIEFFNYIFAFPRISENFPYIHSGFSRLSVNGYSFVEYGHAVGLLYRALPTFGYAALPVTFKSFKKNEKLKYLLLALPVCIIAPAIIIGAAWESGYAPRYLTDFAWQMVLGAITLLFVLYIRKAKAQMRKLIYVLFAVSALAAIIVCIASTFEFFGYINRSEFLCEIANIFNFWK